MASAILPLLLKIVCMKYKSFILFILLPFLLASCGTSANVAGPNSGNIPDEYKKFFETCPGIPSVEEKMDGSRAVVVGYCEHSGQKFTQFTIDNPKFTQTNADSAQIQSDQNIETDINDTKTDENQDLLFQLIPKGEILNSYFEINPKHVPDIAQSIKIDKTSTFSSLSLFPNYVSLADQSKVFNKNYQYDNKDIQVKREDLTLTPSWFVYIYKWKNSTQLNDELDVDRDFTLIHQQRSEEIIEVGKEFNFKLTPEVTLEPGNYLFVFGSIFYENNLFTIRFEGQQNGTNILGGYDHNVPTECKYTLTKDSTPDSKVYRPNFGAKVTTDGFKISYTKTINKKFEVYDTKVGECSKLGDYNSNTGVWNPGDLQIYFYENKPKTFKYLSKTADLPQEKYKNLACDPFDPRLKNYYLPNGVGPEARVSAACATLDWIESGAPTDVKITTYFSSEIPPLIQQRVKNSILAGERTFGKYGSKDRTYSILYSTDFDFSCKTGKEIMLAQKETTPGILIKNRNKWELNRNSGCDKDNFFPGGGEAKVFGKSLQNYFLWTLLKPEDIKPECLDNKCNMMWWVKFLNHEFVHAIQAQRTKKQPRGPEDPGNWAGEGQAMFYQIQTGELHQGPGDYRVNMMEELTTDMKSANISEVKIEEVSKSNVYNLSFSAGYFAWEYLIAHYGPEKAWSWWEVWNGSTCTVGGPDKCWRQASQKTFGKTDQQILKDINTYVNAQLSKK